MDDNLEEFLIKEYLDKDCNETILYEDIKDWVRKLPPILAGTIATFVTSNPTFLGVGATILILEEIGLDVNKLFNNKDKIFINKDNKGIININKEEKFPDMVKQILYEIDMTLMVYDLELAMEYDELETIIKCIDKMIDKKEYSNSKYKIISYYYKMSIAHVINSDSLEVDYFDMMNGLYYLIDLGIISNKELDILVSVIVKRLNMEYEKKEKGKIYDFKKINGKIK